ncbi:MAG: polysulfide reductase NrfD [Anaerolineales bacterium]|nr:polysulfide reductase NrfD [Anaerolineales bacterium]
MATTTMKAESPRPPLITPWRLWVSLLALMLAAGLWGAAQVLLNGLEVTGLNDQVPWGLWITQDLTSIGLGAGAFTFSAIVYLFRIKRFEKIARAAVFVGFLGYTSAMLALAMDIGRPDRFYHPLIYWNVHSVLWEITWCVILYTTILALEFLPILFDTPFFSRWPWLGKFGHQLHKAAPVFAVLGLGLSMLHQSSLGATYGVLSGRAIWFKPSLPIMFITSAVLGGISMTLLLTIIVGKLRNKRVVNRQLQFEISRIAGYIALGYLYIKMWDWAATSYYSQAHAETLARLQATTPYTQTFWWLEIVFGLLVPAIVLLYRPLRRNDRYVMFALGFVVIGVLVNRWNVTLSGLVAPPQWSPGVIGNLVVATYAPSLPEIAVAIGIAGYALLGFSLGARYLPLYPSDDELAHR